MKLRELKDCAMCNTPFYTRALHIINCSKRCTIAYRNRRDANPIYKKMQIAKKNALKNGKITNHHATKTYHDILKEQKIKRYSDNVTNIKGQAGMTAYVLKQKLALLHQQNNTEAVSNNV